MEIHEITAQSLMRIIKDKPLSLSDFAGTYSKHNHKRHHVQAIINELEQDKKIRLVTVDGQRVYVPFEWFLSNDAIYWQIMGKTKQIGGCWEWQGFIDQRGAPQHRISAEMNRPDVPKFLRVRRFLWERLQHETLKPQEIIEPDCGCDNCIRPSHMKKLPRNDKLIGFKKPYQQRLNAANAARAMFGKINMEIAREIRRSNEPVTVIAQRHNMTPANVHMIRRGQIWKEIGPSNNPFAGLVA